MGISVDEIVIHENCGTSDEPTGNSTENSAEKITNSYNEVDVQSVTTKNRHVSVDSGFGSFGPSEQNVVGISSEVSTNVQSFGMRKQSTFDKTPEKYHNDRIADDSDEKQDKLTPLDPPVRRLSDSAGRADKFREYRKNRTTTLSNEEPNSELDIRLINRYDGLKDVICYFDEDGAPKVREKQSKRKSTLRQELQSRNLGASLDNDSMRGIQKKPSCVSFSRLCKKFKESFLSKCHFKFKNHIYHSRFSLYLYIVIFILYHKCSQCSFWNKFNLI